MTREPIYAAAFAFFSALTAGGAPLFKTATRKPKHWEDAAPEDQPMLLFWQRNERAERRKGLPTKWTFNVDLMLYVRTNAAADADQIPGQIMNPLIDAIEAALAVDDPSNNACTLGGLVSHCAIQDEVEYHPGNLGDEAVAIIPIEILVTT